MARDTRYAEMYDAFSQLDGWGSGVTKDDDRKISLEELKAGIDAVKHEFVSLKDATAADAEAMFKEMDADGKGAVLLHEFCHYVEKHEIEAGTEFGKALEAGDARDLAEAKQYNHEQATKARTRGGGARDGGTL